MKSTRNSQARSLILQKGGNAAGRGIGPVPGGIIEEKKCTYNIWQRFGHVESWAEGQRLMIIVKKDVRRERRRLANANRKTILEAPLHAN